MTLYHNLQKHSKALVCLFFLAILLLGVLTITDYGRTWDELGEMRIFRMALMEYGEALPFDTGFHQALSDMGIIPLSQSIEMDHNFSLYYPIAWAACNPALSEHQFTVIWRAHTWLIFTLGLFALYAVCRHMGLRRSLSCLGVLLLLISPRFFADGHYNNKDLALMTAAGLVLWQTLRLADRLTFPRALTFALAAGLCVNTRIIGGAVCGLCGLMLVLKLLAEHRMNRHAVAVGSAALLGSLLCYALLTPALLTDPIAYLDYVVRNSLNFTRWNGTVLFMGQEIGLSAEKPPFYYLPMNILLTTPLLQLVLTGLGTWMVFKRLLQRRLTMLISPTRFAALLCLLTWLLPILAAMVLRTRIYNGWRHFYFVYLPMIATAAWSLPRIWAYVRRWAALRRVVAAAFAVVLLAQCVLLGLNHPFQYAYFNELVSRDAIAQRYDLDYYNISLYQALKQLLAQAPEREKIRVACTDSYTRSGFAFATTYMTPEEDARFELVDYDPDQRAAFYTLANTTYSFIAGFEPLPDMTPIITIRSYGAPLCTLYDCHTEKEVQP